MKLITLLFPLALFAADPPKPAPAVTPEHKAALDQATEALTRANLRIELAAAQVAAYAELDKLRVATANAAADCGTNATLVNGACVAKP